MFSIHSFLSVLIMTPFLPSSTSSFVEIWTSSFSSPSASKHMICHFCRLVNTWTFFFKLKGDWINRKEMSQPNLSSSATVTILFGRKQRVFWTGDKCCSYMFYQSPKVTDFYKRSPKSPKVIDFTEKVTDFFFIYNLAKCLKEVVSVIWSKNSKIYCLKTDQWINWLKKSLLYNFKCI